MRQVPPQNVIVEILKAIAVFLLKVIGIILAWTCKLSGLILTRVGEGIEKLVIK